MNPGSFHSLRGSLPTAALLLAFLGVVYAATEIIGSPVLGQFVIRMYIYLILVVGLQIFMGNSNILWFPHVAFMGIGAYVSSICSMEPFQKSISLTSLYPILADIHLPFLPALLAGALAAAIVAGILGLPLMRLSDFPVVITSFALLIILHVVMTNWHSLTNGPQGIAALDRARIFGLPLTSPVNFYWLLLPLAFLICAGVYAMERSILGKAWRALREDQDVVRGLGINTTMLKLFAFALSASIGGAGGVIFASFQKFVSPESFTFQESLLIVLIIIIGGVGNIIGVIAGAFVLVILPEALHFAAQYRLLIYGVVLVTVIVLRPGGLVSPRFNVGFILRKVRTLWLSSSKT